MPTDPSKQSPAGGYYHPTRVLSWEQGMAVSCPGEGPGPCLHCWYAHSQQGLGRRGSWRNSLQHLMPVDWESNQQEEALRPSSCLISGVAPEGEGLVLALPFDKHLSSAGLLALGFSFFLFCFPAKDLKKNLFCWTMSLEGTGAWRSCVCCCLFLLSGSSVLKGMSKGCTGQQRWGCV